MNSRFLEVLRKFSFLGEAELPTISADPAPSKRTCPPGFRFDGRHCVPIKKSDADARGTKPGSSKSEAIPEGPPPSRRKNDDDDFPHTRKPVKLAQDLQIPTVPDPKSEIMLRPHNAITYANGLRTYEYAEEEWKEYAQNALTLAKFPDAFADKAAFVTAFLNGQQAETTNWGQILNTSASAQQEGDYPSLFAKFWEMRGEDWAASSTSDEAVAKNEFKDYLDTLLERADAEAPETTPPVIIGQYQDVSNGRETDWLIAGNSRALLYAFLGKPAPTRLVPLKGRMLPDPSDAELQNDLWPAEQTEGGDDEVELAVRTAVDRVLQARGAPEAPAPAPAGGEAPPAPDAAAAPPAEAPPTPAAPEAPPAQAPAPAPQESIAVLSALRSIFESTSLEEAERTHASGHTKRLFRRLYKSAGYPVGTVRKWQRGRVVKTHAGWELLPEKQVGGKPASPLVPAAAHDEPKTAKLSSAAKATVSGSALSLLAKAPPPSSDGHWIDAVPDLPKQTIQQHYTGWKQPKRYRQRLHNAILARYFDRVPAPSAKDLKTKKPVAIMLMGGPASGKSTISSAYPDKQFVRLDVDALKEHIPEYRAAIKWRAKNAAEMVHEESVHLMQQLRERTIAARKNLIMDGTGRHLDSYLNMIKKLKDAGYHVKVVMADVDQKTAEKRAKARGHAKGRWIPPNVFDAAYRAVPRNFETIANAADDFELWDTRPEGAPSLKWERTGKTEKVHDSAFVKEFKMSHPPLPPPAPLVSALKSALVPDSQTASSKWMSGEGSKR